MRYVKNFVWICAAVILGAPLLAFVLFIVFVLSGAEPGSFPFPELPQGWSR